MKIKNLFIGLLALGTVFSLILQTPVRAAEAAGSLTVEY